MDAVEIYFGFHSRPTIGQIRAGASMWSVFGHVEAFGYTVDRTWFFLDPRREGTTLQIVHKHDDVNRLMAIRIDQCDEILRVKERRKMLIPPMVPMTCAAQCGHLVGIRAFTLGGLRRKLLAMNAEVLHGPERRS